MIRRAPNHENRSPGRRFRRRRRAATVVALAVAALGAGCAADSTGAVDDSAGSSTAAADRAEPPAASPLGSTTEPALGGVGPIDEDRGVPDVIGVREVGSVAPPLESGRRETNRDCGMTTVVDDLIVWVWCDTVLFRPDGTIRYFLNTTATVSAPDDPLVLVESLDGAGNPFPLLEPPPGTEACGPEARPFVWPSAVVDTDSAAAAAAADAVDAVDGRRRLITYEDVCVGPFGPTRRGMGLAELILPATIDPAAPSRLEARVVEPDLFRFDPGEHAYGQAMVVHEGLLYVMGCIQFTDDCRMGRVDPAAAADIAAYSWWTPDGWIDRRIEAASLDIPDHQRSIEPSLQWIEELGSFVMVASTADNDLAVRFASAPEGPWSPPQVVDLPGCDQFYPDSCYTAELHPALSDGDSLGVTYFDPVPPDEVTTRMVEIDVDAAP